MKFGPKEIKELNEYLRTGRNRKREFLGGGITFASDLTQPEPKREIVEIDAFNRFNRLYGKADGGRIGFKDDPLKNFNITTDLPFDLNKPLGKIYEVGDKSVLKNLQAVENKNPNLRKN